MASDTQRKYSAPAAACAAEVLRLLANTDRALSLAELERETDRTKSLLFRTLQELTEQEFVTRTRDRKYLLGIGAFEVGAAYVRQVSNDDAVRSALRSLSEAIEESTHLSVLRDGELLYLMKVEGPSTYVSISRVGGRVPASCTAAGKMLLSTLSQEALSALIDEPLPRMTPHSITDTDLLRAELAEIRDRGYSRDVEEAVLGRAGLATTISLPDRFEHAAISLSTTVGRLESEEPELVEQLQRAVHRIQRELSSRAALTGEPSSV